MDQNIVDPDDNLVYTKRKLRQLSGGSEVTTFDGDDSSAEAHTPKVPENGWGTSLEKCPLFTRAEMDKHVAKSGKSIGGETHHSLPTGLRKAKTFLKDEYLHDIETNHDQRYFFYRSKCFHSFKKNEKPHELHLAVCIVSGEVKYAHCGPACAAGKSGFCNHILALMLKVCKYTLYNCKDVRELQNETDENPPSACTSTLQKWHKPRIEGISSHPVMEIAVSKTQLEEKKSSRTVTCQLYEARKVDRKTKFKDFYERMQNIDPKLGFVQTCDFEGSYKDTKFGVSPSGSFGAYQLGFTESNFKVYLNLDSVPRKAVSHAFLPPYPSLPLDDLNDDFVLSVPEDLDATQMNILDSLKVNVPEANKIEEETRGQHQCEQWMKERKMRFTASNFGRVYRRQRNYEKFCEDLLTAKPFRSVSTQHGITYEPVALREYEKHMHKMGKPVRVTNSGFFVSPKLFILGCSPDGKVVDIGCQENFGLVEIKCPSSKFLVTPLEACADPRFCLHNINGSPTLKTTHVYYDQVQGQMGLTGVTWCDFIVYTSRGLSIERIRFDPVHWGRLREKLHSVFFSFFLPATVKWKQGK